MRAHRAGPAWVAVEVIDKGSGIHPEHRSRIFDSFFTTTPVGVGTGLGLSICHNLVQALGGEFPVLSELGMGTKFRLVLPAAGAEQGEAPAGAPSTPAARPTALPHIRVLVIDDERSVGESLRRLLHQHGRAVDVDGSRNPQRNDGRGRGPPWWRR